MGTRDALTGIIARAMIAKGHSDVRRMHKNTVNAGKKNEKLLFEILKTNKTSEYGRKYNFEGIKSVEEFRRTVPLTTFSDYEDYVVRMIDGHETNLITSHKIVGYAQSSGTVGKRKFVPLTQPEVDVYTRNTITRMLANADDYSKKHYGHGIRPARGMFTAPSFDDVLPDGTPCSNIADVVAKQFGFIYPYMLSIPFKKMFNEAEAESKYVNSRFALEDRNTLFIFAIFFREIAAYMDYLKRNWQILVDDIEHGTISDLAMATPEAVDKMKPYIKPNPERAAELRAEFEKGFDETIIKRIWPNMSVMSGIGTSTFAPFSKRVREYTKDIPFDFSLYGASEGLMAAADAVESAKQLMLVDSCYYEFMPVDEATDESDENNILSINELEVGKNYEIIITNQSGLYRYRCGDVIKVVEYMNECPYIVFSYRKGQLLNITGEKTTEEHMAEVVKQVGKLAGCTVTDWAARNCIEDHPYYYELIIENKEGMDLSGYTEEAHRILCEVNPRYMYFTAIDGMGMLKIRNQKPGTHKEWADALIASGRPVTQVKPVRIIDSPEKEEFFLSRVTD